MSNFGSKPLAFAEVVYDLEKDSYLPGCYANWLIAQDCHFYSVLKPLFSSEILSKVGAVPFFSLQCNKAKLDYY
jgi:hypothetical protein